MPKPSVIPTDKSNRHFIRQIIDKDLESGLHSKITTRFPPEPNGYLHLGHAKSICLNFGLAQEYEGQCNLRFDDTNPLKEEAEYVDSIKEDVSWLGFSWDNECFASDYFEKLYQYAVTLIQAGKAYVDSQDSDTIRQNRGTLTRPGVSSPFRERGAAENLEMFQAMREGKYGDGEHVLRAKIDMAHPNIVMRDPVLYRIRHTPHHRTGDVWCVYPLYDFAHCLSDAIENITHSVCTLEFENNRALYDWILDSLNISPRPRQYEFARLNLTGTVLSKRKLIRLVEEGHVDGWDDPRMPTLSGLRRRGYTAQAIRTFCERIGVAKADSTVDFALLEHCLREDLNDSAPRVLGVLNPIKITLVNYPEDKVEYFSMPYHPEDPSLGRRDVPFSRELYIEREDFMLDPPKKFFRLALEREVRLRFAYYITCVDVKKDANGEVCELLCSYDPKTRGGWSDDGRKVKGTLHWVSVKHALPAEVRLYERLFHGDNPDDVPEGGDFTMNLSEHSLHRVRAYVESSLSNVGSQYHYQFERLGYFCIDSKDSGPGNLVFNRIATLRDTWARIQRQATKG